MTDPRKRDDSGCWDGGQDPSDLLDERDEWSRLGCCSKLSLLPPKSFKDILNPGLYSDMVQKWYLAIFL